MVVVGGLTSDEFARTQTYLAYARALLADMGLRLSVHNDFDAWRKLLEDAPGTHPLSKTLSPRYNCIREDEGFWLSFDTADGTKIACAGSRVLVSESDFVKQWITTQRLFGNRRVPVDSKPIKFIAEPPALTGRIGFAGGAWVHPDWRRRKLTNLSSRLGRVIGLFFLDCDYHTAFIQERRTRWLEEALGWKHHVYCMSGHHPGREGEFEAEVNFCWMSAAEILELCDQECPLIHEERRRKIA